MPGLFVTATGTDVGKTFVACALIRALRARGCPVDAFKPVLSGFTGPDGSDAALLLEALGRPLSDLDRISPLRFAAPLAPPSAARSEGQTIEARTLGSLCGGRLSRASETLLIIEGAGGVMSPIAEGATNLDLIRSLKTPVLLVTGTYLGAVSHTLTAIAALGLRRTPIAAIVVSDSAGEHPDPAEVLNALSGFAPGIAVFNAPRAAHWDAAALAGHIAKELGLE